MTDLVERLRRNHGLTHDPDQLWDVVSTLTKERHEAADEIERLRAVLRNITDHFADVMGGPLITGQGIQFTNGVEGIPTIAAARAALGDNP